MDLIRRLVGLAPRPSLEAPAFCGLAGGRLQETTLAAIIHQAAARAGLEQPVTAHTLRHTAATWLRQELGDARLVAECLGHADLSTVARYAHVDRAELFAAAGRLERLACPGGAELVAPSASPTPEESSTTSADQSSTAGGSARDHDRRRRRRRRRHARGQKRGT